MEWKIRQTQIFRHWPPGGHLAHIHPLVTLVDKLDGQGPVILPRGVAHCEPLILHQAMSLVMIML